jgi:hypothetical protein
MQILVARAMPLGEVESLGTRRFGESSEAIQLQLPIYKI